MDFTHAITLAGRTPGRVWGFTRLTGEFRTSLASHSRNSNLYEEVVNSLPLVRIGGKTPFRVPAVLREQLSVEVRRAQPVPAPEPFAQPGFQVVTGDELKRLQQPVGIHRKADAVEHVLVGVAEGRLRRDAL